jgi:hypothetical protein
MKYTRCASCGKRYQGDIGSTPCCGAAAESIEIKPEWRENAFWDSANPDHTICPQCGADMTKRHHDGSRGIPECQWWECEDSCGFKTQPE